MKKILLFLIVICVIFNSNFTFSQESTSVSTVENEINSLFLRKSVSTEQMSQLIKADFNEKDAKIVSEKIQKESENGYYFVSISEYPLMVKEFENILSSIPKTSASKNYRYSLQKVYHFEIYLEKLKSEL